MITIKTQGNRDQSGSVELILDTEADLTNLPTDVATGSYAFVIATSKVYMINSQGEWKEI